MSVREQTDRMTGVVAVPRGEPTRHRLLARTLSTARWDEYDTLLRVALELGWLPMDLEQWIASGGVQGRVLILRHDVDQHPATAVKMARIDARHGVRATWYFRWRTCSPAAIGKIRELGGAIGLHYETLTRRALERKLTADAIGPELIVEAREELRREIAAFARRFGPLHSVCAHGDTRVPGVSNQILMRGEAPSGYGIDFDANEALSRWRLALWMTDRSAADGRWEHGADPLVALRDMTGPILCLTHPNNWCAGASLWSDRIAAAVLPAPSLDRGRWRAGMRTRPDRPPDDQLPVPTSGPLVALPRLRMASAVRSFDPIAMSLRREILRYGYDTDQRLLSDAGLRTLETNSGLAETRAATLEHVLARAQVASVRGLDVLDLGCGFGALALVFAARGARVSALDPNAARLSVGVAAAHGHGLEIDWLSGSMATTDLGRERFDVVVMNNSFCYLVKRSDRREALAGTLRALRPGGVLVVYNPNRLRLFDQFTRLPLLGLLGPRAALAVSRMLGRERSHVRLLSGGAARRELRRAGFAAVQSIAASDRGRTATPFAAYQSVVARRPVS